MRKIVTICLIFSFMLSGYIITPAYAASGIAGTAHDFTDEGWDPPTYGNQVLGLCEACHIPHNADTTTEAPLWNHEITVQNYQPYTSQSLKATPEQPGLYSLLCLSCHDGTVAVDSYGNMDGSVFISDYDGSYVFGNDLTGDHPVGIQWTHKEPANCANCHFAHSGRTQLPFYDGKVECATCHDPHNKGDIDFNFLRITDVDSEICLFCHDK